MKFCNIAAAVLSFLAFGLAQILAAPSAPEFNVDIVQKDTLADFTTIIKRYNAEQDLAKRELMQRDLIDTVESLFENFNFSSLFSFGGSLLSDFNLTSILGDIDFESVAGVANSLLDNSFAEGLLEDVLGFVKNTGLVATGIDYVLANNYTRHIAGELLEDVLNVAGSLNTTDLWVALDKSNIAYHLIIDLLEDPSLFPFILGVGSDVIHSDAFSWNNILDAASLLVSKRDMAVVEMMAKRQDVHAFLNSFNKQDVTEFLEKITSRDEFNTFLEGIATSAGYAKRSSGYDHASFARRSDNVDSLDDLADMIKRSSIEKRDNIEDLLVTILVAVDNSGIINSTIHSLLTSTSFRSTVSSLLVSALSDISGLISSLSSLNFSGLSSVFTQIWESGLIQNTFSKILGDTGLRSSLIDLVGSIFSNFNLSSILNSVAKRELDPLVFTNLEMRKRAFGLE